MLVNDPLWFKDAIIYEVHVRAFRDSVGDGMGDFRGLTEKLDYLQDLGVTAIWLLPFYPSPLRDDGYDIADYCDIHTDYGTLKDFKEFLDAAHQRGLRVITELVINHTSDQHPWFQKARRSPPGSAARDFYVWSDTPNKYKGARIIFQDFEHSNWSWDHVANAYYWHRFYSHQPDLNYDNPEVWKAIFPVVDFWMEMGVDGMRLDAVPYLYEREGTNCENLPETHKFLKALRAHVESKFPNRMFLAEANQWPEDAAAYFGAGDECQMNFHFPLMPRMFMAIHMEDSFPILDIVAQTPAIPPNCQWALFLRNHDELTLEMVTDEERDYMYRAYAVDQRARINLGIRHRLAPLLGSNRRRIELMNGLLFSLPGTPIIYYGDEIGMGDNIYLGDRNGVRTPMQWSGDRNAGFSRCNPQKLYLPVIIDPEYHFESVNVEAHQQNPSSLLWWMKRLINLRKRHKAFGRGTIEFLQPENRKILAFLRRHEEENLLVVANLSRFMQYVELDLQEFRGHVPVEMFSRNPLPPITKAPYLLTLGPHSFYWFELHPKHTPINGMTIEPATPEEKLPLLKVQQHWSELLEPSRQDVLRAVLPQYLVQRRWFGSKARRLKSVQFREVFPVAVADTKFFITLLTAEFDEGPAETYVLPLGMAGAEQAEQLREHSPHTIVARCESPDGDCVLFDALADPNFCAAVLQAVRRSEVIEGGRSATVSCSGYPRLEALLSATETTLQPVIGKAEQTNTSVIYGNRVIMKVFRRVDDGLNPDLEIGRYLTESAQFRNTAPVVGAIEFTPKRKAPPMTLAILQEFVPNQGDAWHYTLDVLSSFFEEVLTTQPAEGPHLPPAEPTLMGPITADALASAEAMLTSYLQSARLLARRTAELHLALMAGNDNPAFTPEPFTALYQRSVYQSMRNLLGRSFLQLRQSLKDLPRHDRKDFRDLLDLEPEVLKRFQSLTTTTVTAARMRYHGDYHLGQVLYTGNDFVIIDFEGEPARTISDRRVKRCVLRDVAGMVRSFHYASNCALHGNGTARGRSPGVIRSKDVEVLKPWARYWYHWISATFVQTYRETCGDAPFLPRSAEEFKVLLDAFLLEKAIYELGYELNHRPDWVRIPVLGILDLLNEPGNALAAEA